MVVRLRTWSLALLLLLLVMELHQMDLLLPTGVSHYGHPVRKAVALVPEQVALLRRRWST